MQNSNTYISPNSIPALKCDRRFEHQQTCHKIFTMRWDLKQRRLQFLHIFNQNSIPKIGMPNLCA